MDSVPGETGSNPICIDDDSDEKKPKKRRRSRLVKILPQRKDIYGVYVLKENYSHLAISESKWDRMSEEARKSNIRSFHNTVAVGSLNTVLPTSVAADFPSTSSTTSISLSVPLEVAVELLHISPEIIEGVWKKAAKILATEGAIASAPGHSSSARNVLSTSKTGFHTVKPTKKYQFVCDCPHFSSLKLCSHSVATAEDNKMLSKFLTTFKASKPNITKLATADMPKGRGRKGNTAPRKRSSLPSIQTTINPISSITQIL